MSVNVGLGTSSRSSSARVRISARANVVLPAPRSPESVTRSPGARMAATSAASRRVACSFGKAQTTVVPRPTAESSFTVPPCSSTNERTIERPSPVPRCREPSAWVSKRSNTRSAVADAEHHGVAAPFGGERDDFAGGREADGVDHQIIQDLAQPPLVGGEAADSAVGTDLELEALLGKSIPHGFGDGVHDGANVHAAEIERHHAGVDGGEIQDVVDDGKQ